MKTLSNCFFAALVLLGAGTAQAQVNGYWVDGAGKPVRDASNQCVRAASWSAQNPQPGCDPMPDRVVLLPQADGSVGAVIVQSKQGQQLLNSAFGALAVAADGKQMPEVQDAASVQTRFGAVLGVQPLRPQSFVVQFASGSATELTPQSRPQIEALKEALQKRPVPEITVIGHTDRVGQVEANDQLSLKRAQAVKDILVAAGVSAATISVAGRGEREPLVPTADEVAEPGNRRVEISVR